MYLFTVCVCAAAQRAMSQLNVEIGKCQEVESTLNTGVESGVRKLHTMEVRINKQLLVCST